MIWIFHRSDFLSLKILNICNAFIRRHDPKALISHRQQSKAVFLIHRIDHIHERGVIQRFPQLVDFCIRNWQIENSQSGHKVGLGCRVL